MLNRGGEAPNRQQNDHFSSSCILPFMQMIIRPDGEVSRCCQDALAKTTLGNVETNTIQEIWSGTEYQEFRNNLIESGRKSVKFCENCDSFGISNYFPDIWVDVVARTLVNMVWNQKKAGKKIYLYEDNKVTRYVDKLLKMHGIVIDDIIGSADREILLREDSFTIFSSNDYEVLDEIDYDFKLLGDKYIVYEEVNHSLHTDFIDENLNAETKEFIRFIDTIRSRDTIVFGTGFSAEKINDVFKIDAKYYIDNNQKKEGTDYCGKKIWLPSKLKEENIDDICVVIASLKFNEMKKQLLENSLCKEENIFEGLRYLD